MALRDLFPTNARLFASSLMGDRSPITEKDFSAEELAAMADLIKKKAAKDTAAEGYLRSTVRSPEKYAEFPNQKMGKDVPYQDYLAEKDAKLATYDKTRGKTSVTYSDFPEGARPDEHGWLGTMMNSIRNPAYGVATSLGQFNAQDRGNQYEIQDKYDWNSSAPPTFDDFVELLKRPEAIGNAIMRLGPGVSRPVNIKIPK